MEEGAGNMNAKTKKEFEKGVGREKKKGELGKGKNLN